MTTAPLLRCAPAAAARDDQILGTAAPVTRWLLIEQPGPWGCNALTGSRLDAGVTSELSRRCAEAGIRIMVIRRPGRRLGGAADRQWAYADSRPGREQIRWGRFGTDHELLDVALDGSAGQPSDDPTYLVCTHARHDTCCAIRGRPVAAAVAAIRPAAGWECSHTGGDRFAANVVILPHGLYYGQVSRSRVPGLVLAHEAGQLTLDALRGRSCFPAVVQAAQQFARVALRETGIDSLAPMSSRTIDPVTTAVSLAHRGSAVVVTLRVGLSAAAQRTCAATRAEPTRVYELMSIEGPRT